MTTIQTIDGDTYQLEDTWKKLTPEQVDEMWEESHEKWVQCPTVVDKDGNLWVDETVL